LHDPNARSECDPARDAPLLRAAAELDATLRDSVQDLGFSLAVARAALPPSEHGVGTDDESLLAAAEQDGTWILAPALSRAPHGNIRLELTAVAKGRQEIRRRVATVAAGEVVVQALVLLRGLLQESNASCTQPLTVGVDPAPIPRSAGRAIVATNGAIFGGFAAYGLQRGSGSSDPRVTYPLLAVGTAVGLGTGLLVAEEWDVRPADAWYLAAGTVWGGASGLLLANGSLHGSIDGRYSIAAASGGAGLGLAALGLVHGHVSDGGAALAHSGAAVGLVFGGIGDLALRGTTQATPHDGAGVGTAVGLVGGGIAAHFLPVSTSRVLLIDMGIGLGALAGASVGSPFLFGEKTETRDRLFLGATALGALSGGTVAYFLTRHDVPARRPSRALTIFPNAGVVATTALPTRQVPAYGVGVTGTW
jgi:hypothetical protein